MLNSNIETIIEYQPKYYAVNLLRTLSRILQSDATMLTTEVTPCADAYPRKFPTWRRAWYPFRAQWLRAKSEVRVRSNLNSNLNLKLHLNLNLNLFIILVCELLQLSIAVHEFCQISFKFLYNSIYVIRKFQYLNTNWSMQKVLSFYTFLALSFHANQSIQYLYHNLALKLILWKNKRQMQFKMKPESKEYLRRIERYEWEYPRPVVRNDRPLPVQEIQWASNKHFRFRNDAFDRADGTCKVEHSMKWRWRLCAWVQRESRWLWDYVKRHVSVSFLDRNCRLIFSREIFLSDFLFLWRRWTKVSTRWIFFHSIHGLHLFRRSTSLSRRGLARFSQPNENIVSFETVTWIPGVVRSRFKSHRFVIVVNSKFSNCYVYSSETC